MSRFVPIALSCGIVFAAASYSQAQAPVVVQESGPEERAEQEAEYYGSSMLAPTPTQIIQYKAQLRGQQRMQRMASMQWYGMSASRPRASATPFTGMYSPVWQMPGGRPFAWTPMGAPTVVIVR